MASLVKLQIDSVVYDWNVRKWQMLTGMPPESAVLHLSEGKGITTPSGIQVCAEINNLMGRLDEFVPTVRLASKDGQIIRSQIADWYSHLHHLKVAFNRKCKVIYLADAVNEILRKPHLDEIARLTDSIENEIQLVKNKNALTAEQQTRYDEAYSKIKEQRNALKGLTICNNDIITIYLIEMMESMPVVDRQQIDDLTAEQKSLRESLSSHEKIFSDKLFLEEKKEELKRDIDNIRNKITYLDHQREMLLSRYYDMLTPDSIAAYVTKYSGTFWNKQNVKKNLIEISLRIAAKKLAAPKKKDVGHKSSDKTAGKSKKRVRELEVRAKSLMLYPHKIISEIEMNYTELMRNVANDLRYIDQFVEWAKGRHDHDYTDEYRLKYEEFWKMLRTLPVLTPDEVMKYAASLCKTKDGGIPEWIKNNKSDITEFCSRPGARRMFGQWKKEFAGIDDATFHSTNHKAKPTVLFDRIKMIVHPDGL